MRRCLIWTITIVLFIACYFTYSENNNDDSHLIFNDCIPLNDYSVSLEVTSGTLSSQSAEFILVNSSNMNVGYGDFYAIQMLIDGKWCNIEDAKPDYNLGLTIIPPGADISFFIDWSWPSAYGVLQNGHYRLLKTFSFYSKQDIACKESNNYYVYCEFDIN